jgi:hypothetical protein
MCSQVSPLNRVIPGDWRKTQMLIVRYHWTQSWQRARCSYWKTSCPTTCHEGAWGKSKYSSYSFLTSALDGEWSASRLGLALFPGKGTHCTGGWVNPRAGLDTEARGKILSPLPGIELLSPGRPARSQTLYWLSYPAFRCSCYCVHFSVRGWYPFPKPLFIVSKVQEIAEYGYFSFCLWKTLSYYEEFSCVSVLKAAVSSLIYAVKRLIT